MRFNTNEFIETPHGNTVIWRYMSGLKLEDLITNTKLYLANATKLTDQYEVSIPHNTLKSKRKKLQSSGIYGNDLERKLETFYWDHCPTKESIFVNCWSISPHESYALWKIYLRESKNGVAIKSTVGSVKRSIENQVGDLKESFYMGKVAYKSYLELDELTKLAVITTKKPYYDFEKELRLFIYSQETESSGITKFDFPDARKIDVDLRAMINEIYISPFSDDEYSKKVTALLKANGLEMIHIKESGIRDS